MTAVQVLVKAGSGADSGYVLCNKAGLNRTRCPTFERGAIVPSREEVERIEQALSTLIEVRTKVSDYARQRGWPSPI